MDTPGLILTLQHVLHGGRPAPPTPGVVSAARAHRLAGVLYQSEVDAGRSPAAALTRAWAAQLAGHLARQAWVADRWPRDLPRPMRFKGADLADHLYPNPGCRASRDLDLLVPRAVWPRAVAALGVHARSQRLPDSERWPWASPEAVGLEVDGVLVELHRTPGPPGRWPIDGDAIFARSEAPTLGWGRAPAPRDRCLLWLVDAAKAGFHGDLAQWWDLALMLQRWPGLEPTPVHGLAGPWRSALAGLAALGWAPKSLSGGRPPRALAWPPHEHQGIGYQLDKLRALGLPRALRYVARSALVRFARQAGG